MMDHASILIIDDEVSIRHSLASFFEDEGFVVLTAENGQTGLDLFFKEKIDVVLTDLRMPLLDGLEVMRVIHEYNPDMPIVVISGVGRKEDIIKALRMGAKDYISKPIDELDEICHVVNRVLENAALIKENKQYRRQLEKSEQKYRTITENIAEGVFTVDALENITYVNQAFCDMLGYLSETLLHKNLKDISTPKSFEMILGQTRIRKKGITSRYELELIHRLGQIVHVEFVCSPLLMENKQYMGSIALIRDISNLIELREKYQKFLVAKKTGHHLVPICASCKKIRMDNNHWGPIEEFFHDITFSHGICPDCCDKLYPGFDLKEDLENPSSE